MFGFLSRRTPEPKPLDFRTILRLLAKSDQETLFKAAGLTAKCAEFIRGELGYVGTCHFDFKADHILEGPPLAAKHAYAMHLELLKSGGVMDATWPRLVAASYSSDQLSRVDNLSRIEDLVLDELIRIGEAIHSRSIEQTVAKLERLRILMADV